MLTRYKTQSEKHLRWNKLKHKLQGVSEPELSAVFRMSDETTSLRIHFSQPRQAFLYRSLVDPLSLVFKNHRKRSKSIPARRAIGNGPGRKSTNPGLQSGAQLPPPYFATT
ncbi:MAG: hypothetical protein DRI46_00875 [Chloroflexi bacterium]|nr:MAG: hypothetical protein DRI46_00875 [Chloroflexota bacterium]